jgi:predicted aminopeptidase
MPPKFSANTAAHVPSPAKPPRRRFNIGLRQLFAIAALTFCLGATLAGCSPIYVLRAAYEEGKILWRREPITEILEKPDVTPETQEKLKLVLDVREFARDVIKLNVGNSYASFSYVDRPDLTYLVLAAPKTELRPYTWWFLVVGNVPYKGYFSEPMRKRKFNASGKGYDTNLRTSAAFHAAGLRSVAVSSFALRQGDSHRVVFHELFHNTLYLNGQGAFNESSAFIGHRAAIEFFARNLARRAEPAR